MIDMPLIGYVVNNIPVAQTDTNERKEDTTISDVANEQTYFDSVVGTASIFYQLTRTLLNNITTSVQNQQVAAKQKIQDAKNEEIVAKQRIQDAKNSRRKK
jgi:hypothetical protein